jgi:hypothetical protein
VNLAKDLRDPLVQKVYDFIGEPTQPVVVTTLIGHEAVGQAPAGLNSFRYAQWIVAYSLRQPTKDVFVRVVRQSDLEQALVALHAFLAELEADDSKWSAPAAGLWVPTGWPFVDRASLRETLSTMAGGGGPPVVSIEGSFGEGKRTMAAYIQHLADETDALTPVIREFRREPAPGVLFAVATDFWMKLGEIGDLDTTHTEPERQATTLARQIAFAAPSSPVPIWFVANVIDHTGLEDGLLGFLDELLRLVQETPEIAQKLRILVLCDRLQLLELQHPPPSDARYTLPPITEVEIREWLEAAAPGKAPTLYELAAETVIQSLVALEPSIKLRRLAFCCKVAHGKL